MALVNVTPIMTSNTTPSPYVVSASSSQSNRDAYRAFDGIKNNVANGWATNSTTSGWIKLDFGSPIKCSAISITSRSTNGEPSPIPAFIGTTEAPKNFKIYGSNDDMSYDLVLSLENEVLWTPEETRLYNFETSVTYRYYKLMISSNNGYVYVAIGELEFWQDDGSTPVISDNNNSLRYTLPFGSKLRLDNITSDLTYMLATENDGDNFGTLRVVGEDGKFEMAKAGQKMRKLWGGVATTVQTLTLDDRIENYSNIVLVVNYATSSGSVEGKTAISYPVSESEYHDSEFLITLSLYSGGTARVPYIYFKMKDNELMITSIGTGGYQLPRLISIYGIY